MGDLRGFHVFLFVFAMTLGVSHFPLAWSTVAKISCNSALASNKARLPMAKEVWTFLKEQEFLNERFLADYEKREKSKKDPNDLAEIAAVNMVFVSDSMDKVTLDRLKSRFKMALIAYYGKLRSGYPTGDNPMWIRQIGGKTFFLFRIDAGSALSLAKEPAVMSVDIQLVDRKYFGLSIEPLKSEENHVLGAEFADLIKHLKEKDKIEATLTLVNDTPAAHRELAKLVKKVNARQNKKTDQLILLDRSTRRYLVQGPVGRLLELAGLEEAKSLAARTVQTIGPQ